MSANSWALKKEIYFSKIFHPEGIPLLISSSLLRERGFGQIDLARIVKIKNSWTIQIGEVKSSELGEKVYYRVQKRRISGSLHFLIGIFGFSGCVILLRKSLSKTL